MRLTIEYHTLILLSVFYVSLAQTPDPLLPDSNTPAEIPGMTLVWNDEFDGEGKPDPDNWQYESGFVRNQELQWYQQDNANCRNGLLVIEGLKQQVENPNYDPDSDNWKLNREFAYYTSSSINTRGRHQWQFGRFEIRARVDTALGSWPAIWTLGINGEWPSCGEIDLMEFYRIGSTPSVLANYAWGTDQRWVARWDGANVPLDDLLSGDADWPQKFHVWSMDWTQDTIRIFLDNVLMNETLLSQTLNADGSNPFLQPHYILLNLALGSNGGDPSQSEFPITYEVDYVRVYQKNSTLAFSDGNSRNLTSVFDICLLNDELIITAGKKNQLETPISIFDVTGRCRIKRSVLFDGSDKTRKLDISRLSAGVYLIALPDIVKRFVVR